MRKHGLLPKTLAGAAIAALALTGCRGDGGGGGDAEADDAGSGPGVSSDPCPDAVNEDNGCITLGIITDLTDTFSAVAVPLTEAQEAFWQRVNENGGVGGFDVQLVIADGEYDPQATSQRYQEMRTDILALAQALGSSQVMAILDDMRDDDVIAAPASWNSAWDFESLIVESGANYCFEAMNGVDWAVAERGEIESVMAIGYPTDFGEDAAYGAEAAAEANGLEYTQITTPTGQDNQAEAVSRIVQDDPDLVVITAGPTETATIIAGAASSGWEGTAIGSSPTWNPGLLQSDAAPVLEERYFHLSPWGPWDYDSEGHAAMQEALGDVTPNFAYVMGWAWSYPVLAVLEDAAEMEGGITRENLVEAAEQLESVDYEGILPEEAGLRAGDPSETAYRASVINRVSPDAPGGTELEQDLTVGPTAEAYDYTGPCAALD
ncbi:ABC transporter substrate-binding protein [Nesterenkonia alkaliphila]|uniref:ABC transporter substrate-binding protein n=1 Tax=Nesterenkonia alkaliphila TaxID=1463631 RepID=A0A7K1UIU0_9MICC|nr:ABC transporter substrate-binding protein [Nesterenkonia alkaliphila]MVT26282.1 ABC transporter substrate-binding protein [Nesterenkonia alkaliphila]GFZ97255.1 lipoprotein [Nesterenkonia alkaliphila]